MKEESLLLLSDLQKLINQVVLIDYTIIILDGDKYRTLKMPNILNLVAAYHHFKNMPYFDKIQNMDSAHKRLSANIETGDFAAGEYDFQLENDFNNLCIYDNLIRLDIKEYYGRIYTHKIDFNGHEERYLSDY